MSLWVTLIIVVAGISGVVALVHFTGGSAQARLEDNAAVLEMWRKAQPDHKATNVLLEPAGFAALIDLEDGGTGILWAFGDGVVGRVLEAGELRVGDAHLRIDLPDFTAPHLDVEISNDMVRRIWAETLKTVLTERV